MKPRPFAMRPLWLLAALWLPLGAQAQIAFGGSLADFSNTLSTPNLLVPEGERMSDNVARMADAERENQSRRIDVRETERAAVRSAIGSGMSTASWGLTTVGAASDFLESWRALSDIDGRCTLSDPGPQIPSSCGEAGSKCHACYERATGALNANRATLHRAWCITHTNLSMARSAMAVGDSSSGVHGVAGLSWSLGGKPQIEEAVRGLRSTYDRRQGDFIRAIDGNLQSLGKCEAEHFGERDWYTRFGYMYLDHLRVRYKSADP